jgi:predicted nucleic acid-binding protein
LYTLDTNAIIYYLRNDQRAISFFQHAFDMNTRLYVSAVTEAELFRFSKLSEEEAKQIENLLRSVFLVPVDSQIARTAGLIGRTYNVELADSIIAATAIFTASTILTRRDCRRISISVYSLKIRLQLAEKYSDERYSSSVFSASFRSNFERISSKVYSATVPRNTRDFKKIPTISVQSL